MRSIVFVILLVQVVGVFSLVLQTGDGFLFTSDYGFLNGFGLAVGVGEDLIGIGMSYSDSGYVEKTVKSGFLKLKMKTEWETFKLETFLGSGWGVSVSYRKRVLVPFPSDSRFSLFLGSYEILKLQDSYSSFNAMGLKFLSRSFDLSFGNFKSSFSMKSVGYLNSSLGLASFGSDNVLGFYIPVEKWDRGIIIGGWWKDGLELGLAGRNSMDMGSTDLEILWGVSFGKEYMGYFTGFGLEIGRSKLFTFFSSTGWGIVLSE